MSEKFAVERKKFEHNGRTIYEWDQNIEEVNMYVRTPEGVRAKMLDCNITSNTVSIGIKGNPPYLSHDLFAPIKQKESLWTLEDGELHITLQKLNKGESWLAVFKGHEQLDALAQEELKKRLMLERFQEEHPGFDFSQAQFSGSAPDPRTFMGGMA